MKKLLPIFLILLFAFSVNAATTVSGRPCPGGSGSSCDASTNEVGNRTQESTASNRVQDVLYCTLYTPDCSGHLASAYIYTSANNGVVSTVCAYLDDGDNVPDSGDSQIDCTANSAVEDAEASWATAAMGTGAAVSTANKYWVCMGHNSGTLAAVRTTGLHQFSIALDNPATNMPATLDPGAGSWTDTADRNHSIYISVGP